MSNRNTTTRDRDRRAISRTKPPCHICGEPIDYSLRYPDPFSFTVDHVHPIAKGGSDTLDNKAAAHFTCNRAKWHRTDEDASGASEREFITERVWW